MSKGLRFIFLQIYSFISEPFVKKTFFSLLNYLGTSVEYHLNIFESCIFVDFLFCSTGLHIFPYASTTLS